MLLAGMLILALMLQPLAERLHLPLAAALVLTGFAGSELLVLGGIDTGLRHDLFGDLVFYVFLPLLVFGAAFRIDATMLRRNLFVILLLSLPIMLLSTAVTAGLVYVGIGHAEGFPWIAALLTGAVLVATDASPVTARFARLGVPHRLRVLMEGEDLFNDATAIVTFGIFLHMATHPTGQVSAGDALLAFVIVFFGGLLTGLLVGLAFVLLSRLFDEPVQRALLTVVSAYTAFLLANEVLQVSGVMAVLLTGLIMGRKIHAVARDESGRFVDTLWGLNVYVAGALLFLLMGVTVSIGMFEERWLAMLIGIVAVLVARALGIFATAPLINRLPRVEPLPVGYRQVLFLGGLRGAVVLALSLSLPYELPYWWTIQSIAFGVVLFSLFVQAPLVEPVLRRNGLAAARRPAG